PVTVNHPDALIVFAAKDDIIIGQSVGSAPNTTNFALQAILTAEDDIIIQGNAACPTPDLRLNIEGTLVANADNPFGRDPNGGILANQRSLCQLNETYPSLYVRSRLSFITELSD